MAEPDGNELLLHGTAVALDGRGVLILGPSGSGKSDLALRLIDRGAVLVADDQTVVRREAGGLFARSPGAIAGRIEVRGIGIVAIPHRDDVPVVLCVDLVPAAMVERMPEPATREILGVILPLLRLAPFEASTVAKLRLAAMRLQRQ